MKVILIGATGVIGNLVYSALKKNTDINIITVSRSGQTELNVDISSYEDIMKMYEMVGAFDALINIAGHCWIGPFEKMTTENWFLGINNKLMGQINLVMAGKDYINEEGSFTLTSGFLSDDPIKGAVNYSVVNGGIDNFVFAAAIELKKRLRINAVSPGLVLKNYNNEMNLPAIGQFPVSHEKIVHAYYKSAFGHLSGQVFRVWEPSTQYIRK